MDNFSSRLREERERLSLSQTAFAELAGSSKPSQVRYENGERNPDSLYISALAQAGVDIVYLLTGQRKPSGPVWAMAEQAAKMTDQLHSIYTPEMRAEEPAILPQSYAIVALHEASLSAGRGVHNSGSNIIDHLAFRRDWLQRIGVDPAQACLARVDGSSMQPTLSHNDMVLINTRAAVPPILVRSDKDKRRAEIYAFVQDGEARVKRVERPDSGMIMLLSDNPDYSPEILTGAGAASVQIIGKVVWWGHTAAQ